MRFGVRDKPAGGVGCMDDVGIGEEQVFRLERFGCRDALLLGPKLAGPAGGQRAAGHDGQPLAAAEARGRLPGDIRSAVA